MKNRKFIYLKNIFLLGLLFVGTVSCEREISDEVAFARFSNSAEVFIDGFSGGLDYFPFEGSYFGAFTVDQETKYKGASSMRFDVPTVGDPLGAYSGAIFRTETARDLSGYDALTFWAKGTQAGLINEIGLGQDFEENKYLVTTNLQLTTYWKKYIIPIPDASRLKAERGMFWYAEGAENGKGYTFWIDDLKYEKLGTIAQPRPTIFNGNDVISNTFIGVAVPITGLGQTFNLGSGVDQAVTPAPGYFQFKSSDINVARVNELGIVTVYSEGTAVITASLGGVAARGSLTVKASASFPFAPIPTRNPNNVLSIFSDAYANVPVTYYNGFWTPGSTTGSADFVVNGDKILNYTNFNYVGTELSSPTLDAAEMTHVHFNMYIPNAIPSNFDFLISIEDWGADQADNGGDDTRQQIFVKSSAVVANTWITIDVPLTLVNRNNIGLIIYENINGSSLRNFYLDNIYYEFKKYNKNENKNL
jgi:hypothetical protein